MEIASETERKYDVPEDFRLPRLIGVAGIHSVDQAEPLSLDATYFDTDELTLLRGGRTLRRRSGGGDAGWHLKTPGSGTSRTEHRLPLNGVPEHVPDELTSLVRAIIRRRELKPVARLKTKRVETPLRDAQGRTLALIAQDRVTAHVGEDRQRWHELEVELVDGGPQVLDEVERRLLAAGAQPAAGPSKAARALSGRLKADKTDKSEIGAGKGEEKNPVKQYVREQRDALAEFDPGVRQGDEEAVHKMRVATRRLRSSLKTFKRSFPADADLGDELKWLADLLGTVRDGQVQTGKLLAGVSGAGPEVADVEARIREHLSGQVDRGQRELGDALNSDRYLTLLDRIDGLLDARIEPKPVRRARKSVARADGLLDTALADGVDAELHEARKAYKRARYAVEVFAPQGGKPAKRFVKTLTDLQDVLGAHQDSVVARELLRELGPDSFWFGVLYGRQEQVGKETYAELPAVVKASRKKKLRKWLR